MPSERWQMRSNGPPNDGNTKTSSTPAATIGHPARPQTSPRQAVAHAQAVLVNPWIGLSRHDHPAPRSRCLSTLPENDAAGAG
jgi:hypothetical protein